MTLDTNISFQLFNLLGEPIWMNVELIHSGSALGAISLKNASKVAGAGSSSRLDKSSTYLLVDTQGNGAKIQIRETPADRPKIEPVYVFAFVNSGSDIWRKNDSRGP